MATFVKVDDADASVVYAGDWQHWTNATEYNHTKSAAPSAGDSASLNFTGTQISVYGSLGSYDFSGVPVTQYVIDGGAATTYQAPIVEPGSFTTDTLFFASPQLAPGPHALVVTNMNGTRPSAFFLDYFIFVPSAAPATSSSSSSALSTTASETVSSTSSGVGAGPTGTGGPGKKAPVGAIAGGVVGGVLLVLAALLLVFFCYRRQRRARDPARTDVLAPEMEPFKDWPDVEIEPFTIIPPVGGGMMSVTYPPPSSASAPSGLASSQPQGPYDSAAVSSTAYTQAHPYINPYGQAPSSNVALSSTDGGYGYGVTALTPPSTGSSPPIPSQSPSQNQGRPSMQAPPRPSKSAHALASRTSLQLPEDAAAQTRAQGAVVPGQAPAVQQHADSGVRIPPGAAAPVVEVPPVYTRN